MGAAISKTVLAGAAILTTGGAHGVRVQQSAKPDTTLQREYEALLAEQKESGMETMHIAYVNGALPPAKVAKLLEDGDGTVQELRSENFDLKKAMNDQQGKFTTKCVLAFQSRVKELLKGKGIQEMLPDDIFNHLFTPHGSCDDRDIFFDYLQRSDEPLEEKVLNAVKNLLVPGGLDQKPYIQSAGLQVVGQWYVDVWTTAVQTPIKEWAGNAGLELPNQIIYGLEFVTPSEGIEVAKRLSDGNFEKTIKDDILAIKEKGEKPENLPFFTAQAIRDAAANLIGPIRSDKAASDVERPEQEEHVDDYNPDEAF